MPLPQLFKATKTIPYVGQWTDPDRDEGYIRYSVALDIEGVTEAALTLSGGTYYRHRERHVSFELAVHDHGGLRRVRLARIDWRSLLGGHSNRRGKCNGEWDGKRVPDTHFHTFDLNWVASEGRMKNGKLPCAVPIDEPLPTFEELRNFVGLKFNISNIDVVPYPQWVYDLFGSE